MNKYLVLLKNGSYYERFETLVQYLDIVYKRIREDRYEIWTTETRRRKLNDNFEWIAVLPNGKEEP